VSYTLPPLPNEPVSNSHLWREWFNRVRQVQIDPSLVTNHNLLNGLQGGVSGEFFHVTGAQGVIISNTSGTNTGDHSTNNNYVNDYRSANFTAGVNYASPSGSVATVTSAAQPAITSVGTLVALSVTATIVGSVSGSAATVTAAAQPAITSVGTLVKIVLSVYTVATLPAGSVGSRSMVNDGLTPVFGSAVVGGGTVTVPVYYTGTAWFVG